jgi:hypothetical protein
MPNSSEQFTEKLTGTVSMSEQDLTEVYNAANKASAHHLQTSK